VREFGNPVSKIVMTTRRRKKLGPPRIKSERANFLTGLGEPKSAETAEAASRACGERD